jgi:hypothetical protein
MTHHAESRADAALVGDAPELFAAFIANLDAEGIDALRKMLKDDETEAGDLLYNKLTEYAEKLTP